MDKKKEDGVFLHLLRLSEHKELKLRRKLVNLERECEKLDEKKSDYMDERKILWLKMKENNIPEDTIKSADLAGYKSNFHQLYERDRQLLEEINSLNEEKEKILISKNQTSENIKTVFNKQEKIKAFINGC